MTYTLKADENIENRILLSDYVNPITPIKHIPTGEFDCYGVEYSIMNIEVEDLEMLNELSQCFREHFNAEMVVNGRIISVNSIGQLKVISPLATPGEYIRITSINHSRNKHIKIGSVLRVFYSVVIGGVINITVYADSLKTKTSVWYINSNNYKWVKAEYHEKETN